MVWKEFKNVFKELNRVSNGIKCEKCEYMNETDKKYCVKCGHKLIVKNTRCNKCFHMNNDDNKYCEKCGNKLIKNGIRCSECGCLNENENKYCVECRHKLKPSPKNDKTYKEYCPICQDMISNDMDYCGKYGHEIRRNVKEKVCPICGEWVVSERYCLNCGHEFKITVEPLFFYNKICPNCNTKYDDMSRYCNKCGTKLKK